MHIAWRNQNTIAEYLVKQGATAPEKAIKATIIQLDTQLGKSTVYGTLRLSDGFVKVFDTNSQLLYWYDYANNVDHCQPGEYYPRVQVSVGDAKVIYINKPVEKVVNAKFNKPDITHSTLKDTAGIAIIPYFEVEVDGELNTDKVKERFVELLNDFNLEDLIIEALSVRKQIDKEIGLD